MGLKKMLCKDGSSHKFVVDRSICDLLGWTSKTVLDITTDGISLIIRADGVDASGGKVGLRSAATRKRKTKELEAASMKRRKKELREYEGEERSHTTEDRNIF